MLVRRETPADVDAIAAVTAAAFAGGDGTDGTDGTGDTPVEVTLLDALRASPAWLPALSFVADGGDARGVIGHIVCTRGHVDGRPALGLGPLSVHPTHQRKGIGSALMHTVLGAADALDEPLVVLLGYGEYYHRFGFVPADRLGIVPPVPDWAPHFHARPLSAYTPDLRGAFAYAQPFSRV